MSCTVALPRQSLSPPALAGVRCLHASTILASAPWRNPIYSSNRLTVHKSIFEAHVSQVPPRFISPDSSCNAKDSLNTSNSNWGVHSSGSIGLVTQRLEPLFDEITRLYSRTKRASHCMYAWRIAASSPRSSAPSVPNAKAKPNPTGAPTPPAAVHRLQVISGSVSGGESGAGERLERLLEMSTDCSKRDVVLVVYRWYGGVKLGSERWKCISGVAKEALTAASEKGWK